MHERRSFDRHDTGVRTQLKFLDTSAARGPPGRSLDEKYLRTICSSGGHLQAAIIHRVSFRTFLWLSDYAIYIGCYNYWEHGYTSRNITESPFEARGGDQTTSSQLQPALRAKRGTASSQMHPVPAAGTGTACLGRYTTMHLRQFLHPV